MTAWPPRLIMAVYPNARGFSYFVLEEPACAVDWGAADIASRGRAETTLRRLCPIFDQYPVDVLMVRGIRAGASSKSLASVIIAIQRLARARGIPTAAMSASQVRRATARRASATRYEVAEWIVETIPTLRPLLPPKNKIWIGESRRMGLFDAAALALATATCVA